MLGDAIKGTLSSMKISPCMKAVLTTHYAFSLICLFVQDFGISLCVLNRVHSAKFRYAVLTIMETCKAGEDVNTDILLQLPLYCL